MKNKELSAFKLSATFNPTLKNLHFRCEPSWGKKLGKGLGLTLALLVFSSCGKQIEEFVAGGRKRVSESESASTTTFTPSGIKVSAGGGLATGESMEALISLSPHQRTLSGDSIEAQISIGSQRVE